MVLSLAAAGQTDHLPAAGVRGGVYNLGTFSDDATVIDDNHASTSNDDLFP